MYDCSIYIWSSFWCFLEISPNKINNKCWVYIKYIRCYRQFKWKLEKFSWTYFAFGFCKPLIPAILCLAERLFAPNSHCDSGVCENENGQREKILEDHKSETVWQLEFFSTQAFPSRLQRKLGKIGRTLQATENGMI